MAERTHTTTIFFPDGTVVCTRDRDESGRLGKAALEAWRAAQDKEVAA
jgi:hypothetical protein